MKNYKIEAMIVIALMTGPVAVYADTVTFRGQLDMVLEDSGGAVYSGVPIGKYFFGSVNDQTFGGFITDGTTRTNIGCCIAAGGLSIDNNDALDADTATLLNDLSGTNFVAGDLVDAVNLEGDAATAGGGRIEIGLSYILKPTAFANDNLSNYPFKPDDVLVALFFITEEDGQGDDIFSGLGELDSDMIPLISALGDINGNSSTDIGVLLRDPASGKNTLYVMDGGSGDNITSLLFGSTSVLGSAAVPDITGDLIAEHAVLIDGDTLFARVKNVVDGKLLGSPKFNADFKPVALLSVGQAGGPVGPDLAVLGYRASNGKVKATVKDVTDDTVVSKIDFSTSYIPLNAVTLENTGDSAAMEIAVLGVNVNGRFRAEVKDALTGNLINRIQFDKNFVPLFFEAVPNSSGKLKHLAVLGRNGAGNVRSQIKRVSNGTLVNKVKFSSSYSPSAFLRFADSNGNGRGEIGVVGVNGAGKVRAVVKEIDNGATVSTVFFSSSNGPPLGAISINGAAGTGRNEIAVLGQRASGKFRVQIKDVLTGNLVKNITVP